MNNGVSSRNETVVQCRWGILHDNLVISNELIMQTGRLKTFLKMMSRLLAFRQSDNLNTLRLIMLRISGCMASGTVNVGGGVTKGWIHDPLKNKFRLFFCKVLNRKLQNHIQTLFYDFRAAPCFIIYKVFGERKQ